MLNPYWNTPLEIRILKERGRAAERKAEVRRRVVRLGVLASFFLSSVSSSVPECTDSRFWVAEKISPSQLAEGVGGKNHISVPDFGATDALWVNSLSAYKDRGNWVEIGWYAWQSEDGEKHWNIFGRRTVEGEYVELFDLPTTPQRDYQFLLSKVSESEWEFIVIDLGTGRPLHVGQYNAPLDRGYIIAQQERHNRCLHQETHWWDLGYWTGVNWHPWPGMIIHYDNDPDYTARDNTAKEFWVERPYPF